MQQHYNARLERAVYGAIRALESERFYEYSDDLLELLRKAKHSDRLLGSVLDGACGVPYEENQKRLKRAEKANSWWGEDV